MNETQSNRRSLDDIDVRAEEADAGQSGGGRIEFATFAEGEYVESILVERSRAAEIYSDLGRILDGIHPRSEGTGRANE